MRGLFIYVVCYLVIASVSAQTPPLYDNNFIFSNDCREENGDILTLSTRMTWDGGRRIWKDTVNHAIDAANATISDADGNLLFYTNGCRVITKDHELMENGDSLNLTNFYPWISNCERAYVGWQGHMIIPSVSSNQEYYLLHKSAIQINGTFEGTDLRATLISFEDNDLGRVVYKDSIVGDRDSVLLSYLTAIRQADGESWWISILQGVDTSRILIYALDSSGLHFSHDHVTEFHMSIDEYSASGFSKFSPDGRSYAIYNPKGGLHVYDFNLQDGTFTNLRRAYVESNDRFGFLEYSANSRFIYFATADTLWQADLDMPDLQESIVMIDEWDGFSTHSPTMFQIMQRGPDCKIYISSLNTTPYLHVINKPDEKGTACNFRQRDIDMFCPPGGRSMPNFPVFTVGSKEDVCNEGLTTWIPEVPHESHRVDLYPNPTHHVLQVDVPDDFDNNSTRYTILDPLGRVRQHGQLVSGSDISVDDLPTGWYILQVSDDSGHSGVSRFVRD